MVSDVARHVGRPQPSRQEFGALDEEGSDLGPLDIIQHRQIDCARQVIFGKLGGAADVDGGVVFLTHPRCEIIGSADHGADLANHDDRLALDDTADTAGRRKTHPNDQIHDRLNAIRRYGNQQATARLRISQQITAPVGCLQDQRDRAAVGRPVPNRRPRPHAGPGQIDGTRKPVRRIRVDLHGRAAATRHLQGVDPRPFLVCVMMAASAAFATPFGYQTNVLVFNMGRYSYMDFVRVGLPLNLVTWIAAMIAIPIFFPF